MEGLTPEKKAIIRKEPSYTYQVQFEKLGGLVLPLIVELTFEDGSKKRNQFPAEIWRRNDIEFFKVFKTNKKVTRIIVDPQNETADINMTNNSWPKKQLTEFQKFKSKKREIIKGQ